MWHLLTMCSAHFRVAKYPIKPPFFWLCQELFFLEIGFVKGEKIESASRYSNNFGFPRFNISSSHFCLYFFFLLSFVFGMLLAFSLIEET